MRKLIVVACLFLLGCAAARGSVRVIPSKRVALVPANITLSIHILGPLCAKAAVVGWGDGEAATRESTSCLPHAFNMRHAYNTCGQFKVVVYLLDSYGEIIAKSSAGVLVQ